MRLVVHDYAGHPFQVQLSRGLAALGHEVLHLYSEGTQTPRGELNRKLTDPDSLAIRAVDPGTTIPKYRFWQRFKMESDYGRRLVAECHGFNPDVVLSANTPSLAQFRLAKDCQRRGVRLVSWIQDMYGIAAYRILKQKLPLVGHAVGRWFMSLDRRSALLSDQIVVITEDFIPVFEEMGIDSERIHTIHNWAPLESLPPGPRDNHWSTAQGLGKGVRFVYSGTLSVRHNPKLLLDLARQLDEWGNAELIVISQGEAVDWLAHEAEQEKISSLRCLPFQPFSEMQHVFASADILVAILEPDAGVFCVPSKVLSYMCARRALLAAIPADNLAARIISGEKLGLAVAPSDFEGFISAARSLYDSATLREACGTAARRYAEENFEAAHILRRFCDILGLAPPAAPAARSASGMPTTVDEPLC